ncbi:MAG: PepSY-like domain-containing protein [Bacteroidota bacterium]
MKKQMLGISGVIMTLLISCNDSGTKTTVQDTMVVAQNNTVVKTRTVEVKPVVQTKFTERYPKAADVEWTRYEADNSPVDIDWELAGWPPLDTMDYAAHYTMDNTDYWSWFTDEGEWISTVAVVPNSSLPDAVNLTLQNQFTEYTVKSVSKENDKNRTAYEIKMEKGDDKMKVLIDEKGNIMKKKGTEAGVKTKEKMVE